jgi:hypothetical protein
MAWRCVEGDPHKERNPHCCNVVWQCGGRKSHALLQFNVAITLKEIYVRKETHIAIVGNAL